jgi:hypothetical protein
MTSKSRFSPLEFLILIVGIPMAVWAVMWSYNGVQAHTAPQSVLGVSTISAQKIDKILCAEKSSACGTGQDIVNRAWQYDIDGAFLLAVFHEGSNYGKLACNPTPACITFKKSWDTSYDVWLSTVKTQYVNQGITTIPAILSAMAPPNEGQYAQAVNTSMNTWRSAS